MQGNHSTTVLSLQPHGLNFYAYLYSLFFSSNISCISLQKLNYDPNMNIQKTVNLIPFQKYIKTFIGEIV